VLTWCRFVCLFSYNLLCEDDPDDFISVEIPMDAVTTDSDAPPLELTEIKKKGKFLESLRRNHTSSGDMQKTVVTGRRRSGRISMGSGDRGSRSSGKVKGGGSSVSPHKMGGVWTDASGEGVEEDGERKTRSSEPLRHNSHSSYEVCGVGRVGRQVGGMGGGIEERKWKKGVQNGLNQWFIL